MEPALLAFMLAIAPTPADQAFAIAQESSLIGWGVRSGPPPDVRLILGAMGGSCGRCRDRATNRWLPRRCAGEIGLIAHALESEDPEVRWRGRKALHRLSRCMWCRGTGFCPDYEYLHRLRRCQNCLHKWPDHWRRSDVEDESIEVSPPCGHCGGTGRMWRFLP